MIDLVENFKSKFDILPEHVPGEDINPNPLFSEADSKIGINFVPEVKETREYVIIRHPTDTTFNEMIRQSQENKSKHFLVGYDEDPRLELILEQVFEDTSRYVSDQGYDLKVIDEIIADGYGVGFCMGNIRTHLDKFSSEKKRQSLLDVIHYASMALYAMNKEIE